MAKHDFDYSKFDKVVRDFEKEEAQDQIDSLPKLDYSKQQDRDRLKYLYPNITVTRKEDWEKQEQQQEQQQEQRKALIEQRKALIEQRKVLVDSTKKIQQWIRKKKNLKK